LGSTSSFKRAAPKCGERELHRRESRYRLSPTYQADTKRIEAYQLRCCGTRVWQENMSLLPRLLAGGILVGRRSQIIIRSLFSDELSNIIYF